MMNAAKGLIGIGALGMLAGRGGSCNASCGSGPRFKQVTTCEKVTAFRPQTTFKPVTIFRPETTFVPYTTFKPVTKCVEIPRPKCCCVCRCCTCECNCPPSCDSTGPSCCNSR